MHIVPLELKELNELVERWHRHHKRVQGHRFSLGVVADHGICGGCAVGRPVARLTDAKTTLEVTRLVTDGTANACSILYAAAARVGREMGYRKIQTFILESEPGTSLKAAGWVFDGLTREGGWVREKRPDRRTDQPMCAKARWAKYL